MWTFTTWLSRLTLFICLASTILLFEGYRTDGSGHVCEETKEIQEATYQKAPYACQKKFYSKCKLWENELCTKYRRTLCYKDILVIERKNVTTSQCCEGWQRDDNKSCTIRHGPVDVALSSGEMEADQDSSNITAAGKAPVRNSTSIVPFYVWLILTFICFIVTGLIITEHFRRKRKKRLKSENRSNRLNPTSNNLYLQAYERFVQVCCSLVGRLPCRPRWDTSIVDSSGIIDMSSHEYQDVDDDVANDGYRYQDMDNHRRTASECRLSEVAGLANKALTSCHDDSDVKYESIDGDDTTSFDKISNSYDLVGYDDTKHGIQPRSPERVTNAEAKTGILMPMYVTPKRKHSSQPKTTNGEEPSPDENTALLKCQTSNSNEKPVDDDNRLEMEYQLESLIPPDPESEETVLVVDAEIDQNPICENTCHHDNNTYSYIDDEDYATCSVNHESEQIANACTEPVKCDENVYENNLHALTDDKASGQEDSVYENTDFTDNCTPVSYDVPRHSWKVKDCLLSNQRYDVIKPGKRPLSNEAQSDVPYDVPKRTSCNLVNETSNPRYDVPKRTTCKCVNETSNPRYDVPKRTTCKCVNENSNPRYDVPKRTTCKCVNETSNPRYDVPKRTNCKSVNETSSSHYDVPKRSKSVKDRTHEERYDLPKQIWMGMKNKLGGLVSAISEHQNVYSQKKSEKQKSPPDTAKKSPPVLQSHNNGNPKKATVDMRKQIGHPSDNVLSSNMENGIACSKNDLLSHYDVPKSNKEHLNDRPESLTSDIPCTNKQGNETLPVELNKLAHVDGGEASSKEDANEEKNTAFAKEDADDVEEKDNADTQEIIKSESPYQNLPESVIKRFLSQSGKPTDQNDITPCDKLSSEVTDYLDDDIVSPIEGNSSVYETCDIAIDKLSSQSSHSSFENIYENSNPLSGIVDQNTYMNVTASKQNDLKPTDQCNT